MLTGIGRPLTSALAALVLAFTGCSFGPKSLEGSHRMYNDAVKLVNEEQLLLNIVRVRYNDTPERIDVSAIAAQYELGTEAQARPFSTSQAARFVAPDVYKSFEKILPYAGVSWTNRPTISMTPLDDPDTIRGLFTPSTLDGIIFLSETSWPVSTIFRVWVEYLNQTPNAVTASGPPRSQLPDFQDFQRVTEIMQTLQDQGNLRFVREEKWAEIAGALPEASVTAPAILEADKNGYRYQQKPDKTWVLYRRERQLSLKVNPAIVNHPEVVELCRLLHLKPGLAGYEIAVGAPEALFAPRQAPAEDTKINLVPRSTVQSLFYLSHGVAVPLEHLNQGIVEPAIEPDGAPFDWRQVTKGLFTVCSCKQHFRPKSAYVAVKYRDYWYYIDDRDSDSKRTFVLMSTMTRVNLIGMRKGGPTLTLPVGH